MAKKYKKDLGRYQIWLKDPSTVAFVEYFPGRKSELIQAALEQYMQTDNRHTRELKQKVDESMVQIARAQEILGYGSAVGSAQTAPIPALSEVIESPRMPAERPDLPFDLSRAEEEEEIFGDIDI